MKYVVDTTDQTGRDKTASDLTESEAGAPNDNEVRKLARMLYRALKEDDPSAFLGGLEIDEAKNIPPELLGPDDLDLFDRTTVDGRFNFVSIAEKLLSEPSLGPRLRQVTRR